jgi:hypothetical protein
MNKVQKGLEHRFKIVMVATVNSVQGPRRTSMSQFIETLLSRRAGIDLNAWNQLIAV